MITDIELVDGARAIVKTEVLGQSILARITRKSLEHLSLEKGKPVYLQIKTVALLSETLIQEPLISESLVSETAMSEAHH